MRGYEQAQYDGAAETSQGPSLRQAMTIAVAKVEHLIDISSEIEANIFGARLKAASGMAPKSDVPEPMPTVQLSGERMYNRLEELEKILLTIRGRL